MSEPSLTWKQRNADRVNAQRRAAYAAEPEKHRAKRATYRVEAKDKELARA